MFVRPILALLSLAAAVAVVFAPVPSAAATRRPPPLPAWSLVGSYNVEVDPGFVSLQGSYEFDLEGRPGQFTVNYDEKSVLRGNGIIEMTFFPVHATSRVGADHLQHVRITDNPKSPSFTFDGVVQPDGRDLVGTYLRTRGFGGLTGTQEGPLTFQRTFPPTVPSTFRLRLATTMDRKGRVRGPVSGGKETRAALDVYPARTFSGGLVRGRVTTVRGGGTTAKLNITGRNWSVAMSGPVDVDGFHATAAIRAGAFVATKVPVLLEVGPGPLPPPPPPPPDPDRRRRVTGAIAQNTGGAVRITKSRLPTKFFGAPAFVTIDFPSSGIGAPMEASTSTASAAPPIRFFVKIGGRTYGTAAPAGRVTLTVKQFSGIPGGLIEVLCKGRVADASGRTKRVDMLVDAVLGQ